MTNPRLLAQALMQNSGNAPQPNMMQKFTPTFNPQGQMQYPTAKLQQYAQGKSTPLYMAGKYNNPIVNDMAYRMNRSQQPFIRGLASWFGWNPGGRQSIYEQLAEQVPYE